MEEIEVYCACRKVSTEAARMNHKICFSTMFTTVTHYQEKKNPLHIGRKKHSPARLNSKLRHLLAVRSAGHYVLTFCCNWSCYWTATCGCRYFIRNGSTTLFDQINISHNSCGTEVRGTGTRATIINLLRLIQGMAMRAIVRYVREVLFPGQPCK